ncbi:MAG TPA: TIGR03746 family integrating conjugative element protein, partial [Gammaproteobacteria bacterium]|nr:TIGR03746 family integrating conjugative element protein [Gammaproteobacteria bacterium]
MRFQNALENAHLALKVLVIAFITSFLLNVMLVAGWFYAQAKVKVYLPPQVPPTGITLQAGEYPHTTIYSFTYYIWQMINHWPINGTEDYKKNIERFSSYLTPNFKSFLIRDYNERLNQGELQNRLRTVTGVNGVVFDQGDVQQIKNGVWIIRLKMRLNEHMNMNGNEIKNVEIEYMLRIVRYETDIKSNPWGLAIDGFFDNPKRSITTNPSEN